MFCILCDGCTVSHPASQKPFPTCSPLALDPQNLELNKSLLCQSPRCGISFNDSRWRSGLSLGCGPGLALATSSLPLCCPALGDHLRSFPGAGPIFGERLEKSQGDPGAQEQTHCTPWWKSTPIWGLMAQAPGAWMQPERHSSPAWKLSGDGKWETMEKMDEWAVAEQRDHECSSEIEGSSTVT